MSFDFGNFNDVADLAGIFQRQQILDAIKDSKPSAAQRSATQAENEAFGSCMMVVVAVVVTVALWWIYGDSIVAWFSAAIGFAGRVGPTILAIGVGGGVLFLLWKIRKRFFSLVRDFVLVDREDGDTTDNRRVYQTLLRSMCCVMAADGKIVADEVKAAKKVLELVDSPLSESEVAKIFVEFRARVRSIGFAKELEATIASIRTTLADDNFRDTFRRILKRIAEADGEVDAQEKKAANLMLTALGT